MTSKNTLPLYYIQYTLKKNECQKFTRNNFFHTLDNHRPKESQVF